MSCRKWQRECLEYARSAGVENARLENGGKHIKLVGTINGAPFLQILSRGSHRGPRVEHNMRASINRALRAHNQET
jgi:hypothetical protein